MQGLVLERRTLVGDVLLVLLASFVLSISGQIAIPLWFTPVPVALRNSLVLLFGALLGARKGAAAVFLFLAQGALGFPVFVGGAAGIAPFFGPLGGYLVGYLVGAFAVGYIAERRQTLANAGMALIVGNLIIYVLGASYLATFVGLKKAFFLGVAPFLLGDLIKTLISLKMMERFGWKRA